MSLSVSAFLSSSSFTPFMFCCFSLSVSSLSHGKNSNTLEPSCLPCPSHLIRYPVFTLSLLTTILLPSLSTAATKNGPLCGRNDKAIKVKGSYELWIFILSSSPVSHIAQSYPLCPFTKKSHQLNTIDRVKVDCYSFLSSIGYLPFLERFKQGKA